MTAGTTDRAAAIRDAIRTLVARHGLHGTSMAAVAKQAGVATGTAYVHYSSKDELLFAAYLELKGQLGTAAVAGVDRNTLPAMRFRSMWMAIHRFLSEEPERAAFLAQVDSSPVAAQAYARALASGTDPILLEASRAEMIDMLADLPFEVLYDLGLAPAVRLVASGTALTRAQLEAVADGCWRAISRPSTLRRPAARML